MGKDFDLNGTATVKQFAWHFDSKDFTIFGPSVHSVMTISVKALNDKTFGI